MDFRDRLDVLSRLSGRPEIEVLVRKAKLVKAEVEEYGVRVWTQDDRSWEIRKTIDGDIYCTCPSFRFSKSDPKTCKHLTAISAMLSREEIPVYVHKSQRSSGTTAKNKGKEYV
jgi:predicted nucleic acid-binding Zn finger protein